MQQQGVTNIMHYLDDFLTLSNPGSQECQNNLDIIKHTCNSLGVPLAAEKVEGPSTTLTFLGITIDTVKMEISLPGPKLSRIHQLANKMESQEKRNTFISWAPTACNQSGERRKDICEQDVFTRCTDKKRWITSNASMQSSVQI